MFANAGHGIAMECCLKSKVTSEKQKYSVLRNYSYSLKKRSKIDCVFSIALMCVNLCFVHGFF